MGISPSVDNLSRTMLNTPFLPGMNLCGQVQESVGLDLESQPISGSQASKMCPERRHTSSTGR